MLYLETNKPVKLLRRDQWIKLDPAAKTAYLNERDNEIYKRKTGKVNNFDEELTYTPESFNALSRYYELSPTWLQKIVKERANAAHVPHASFVSE